MITPINEMWTVLFMLASNLDQLVMCAEFWGNNWIAFGSIFINNFKSVHTIGIIKNLILKLDLKLAPICKNLIFIVPHISV